MDEQSRVIPALSGELLQYLVHEQNDNTIRFVLRYPVRLDTLAMQTAVLAVVDSVDVLHAAFVVGKGGAAWHVRDTYSIARCFRCFCIQGDPAARALEESLLPMALEDSVKLRCTLVQGKNGSALAVSISHLCADGVDSRYLLYKMAEAYRLCRETGSCAGLRIKSGSRAPEQVYNHLSRREMRSLLRNPTSGVKTGFPFPGKGAGEKRITCRRIAAPIMKAARERARADGATANDLLLTACYRAIADCEGMASGTPLSLMSMMDLRRHCEGGDSEGLSNLSGSLPTALEKGVQGSFADTLRDIAAQTALLKEDPLAGLTGMPILHGLIRRVPLGLLMRVTDHVYGSMAVGMTNLGQLDSAALTLDNAAPETGWFGGPVKKKPGMQLSVVSVAGACTICVYGEYEQADAVMLEKMLEQVEREISNYALQ